MLHSKKEEMKNSQLNIFAVVQTVIVCVVTERMLLESLILVRAAVWETKEETCSFIFFGGRVVAALFQLKMVLLPSC